MAEVAADDRPDGGFGEEQFPRNLFDLRRLDHVPGDVVFFLLANGGVVVGRAIGLQKRNSWVI